MTDMRIGGPKGQYEMMMINISVLN